MWEVLLAELAGIPRTCSPSYLKDSNGYFNCEVIWDANDAISSVGEFSMNPSTGVAPELTLYPHPVTSTLFEAKQLQTSGQGYHWIRFNFIVSWLAPVKQTRVFIMEAPAGFNVTLSDLISAAMGGNEFGEPFWMVQRIVNSVVGVFDTTVWAVRDEVRNIEMLQMPPDRKPSPNYRYMHDLARHAIHVSESLDVSLETIGSIIRHHDGILKARSDRISARVGKTIHSRLQFMENILHSLRSRSDSNQQRLLNEIQLAFHTVAQYDSNISVEITQADSTAMRTVAFVTLSALPATFVSSIFSMSFFNFDTTSGFISDKFWMFWAITIPLTIGISVFCTYSRIVPSFGLARTVPV